MPAAVHPHLQPGRVYRTRDLAVWGANPTRLAKRLLHGGKLRQLAQGLYYAPAASRFGPVPPDDAAILRAFIGDDSFVVTGPPRWNSLGLGTTAMFSSALVYNGKRSGEFRLGSRLFQLRRVRFPSEPSAEWFVIDLLEHHDAAGAALSELEGALTQALRDGRFDRRRLAEMAAEFGTRATLALVRRATEASSS